MKLALVAALALAGCITVDRGHPPAESESLLFMYEQCGYAPAAPKWTYSPASGDPAHVVVPTSEFNSHNAWLAQQKAWTDCVQAAIDATAQ